MAEVAEKIGNMGERRKSVVRLVVGKMVNRSAAAVARVLRTQAASKKDKDRDWLRVARTELTNNAAMESHDRLLVDLGEGAFVFRDTSNCCDACAKIFGKPGNPKRMRLGEIKAAHVGAIHPNCKCSEWKEWAGADMHKAERVLRFGFVRRTFGDGEYPVEISTGSKWVSADSITGRNIMNTILRAMPLVVVEEAGGWLRCRHGHGRPKSEFFGLLRPKATFGARFYPRDPDADPDGYMAYLRGQQAFTFDGYAERTLQVLPAVLGMPEWWGPNGTGYKFLTEFMGYKSLTDWWAFVPPAGNNPTYHSTGGITVRAACHRAARAELEKMDMKKWR